MSIDVHAQQPALVPAVSDAEPVDALGASGCLVGRRRDVGEKKQAQPVSASERFFAVDVLRGFALLGILAMNIVGFGWPCRGV